MINRDMANLVEPEGIYKHPGGKRNNMINTIRGVERDVTDR